MSHKLYNHIAEELCRRIAAGDYPVGSKLASHRDLRDEFKVSSRTVYKALAELKARGVFRPTPRGSFVTGHGFKDAETQVIVIATPEKDLLTLENDPLKQEIFSAAAQAGYETVLLKLNRKNFKSLISFYNQKFCGGIVFIYSTGYKLQNYSDLTLQVPYVCTNYIPGDEHFFAKKYIFPAGSTQGVITVSGGGKFFYRIAELTPFRRIAGALSAEKSLDEFDRSTPAAVEYTLERKQHNVLFKTAGQAVKSASKLLVLTRNAAGAAVKTVAEAPVTAGEIAVAGDKLQNFAALAVADKFGKYAMPERWYFCGNQPDISVNTSPLIAQNKDVALSDRIMTVGEKSTVSFTFRNNGGASGKTVAVVTATDNSGNSQELLRQDAGEITPGSKKVVSVEYTPQKAGKIIFALELQTPGDVDKTNNRLTLELYATQQKIYFLWYGGNVMELEYANYASVHSDDLAEFTRRGGKLLTTTSRTEQKSGEDYYKKIKSAHAVGMQLDEIGGRLKAARFLPAIIDCEKQHPELLSAVWHIGNDPQKEVIDALKKREIDLLMPEIYFADGTAKERANALKSLRARLEKLRKTGVAEYMLIGLGTHRNYLGWGGSPAKHAEFIEEQIKLVREILPMTPGIAFYSSAADVELLKKVDRMCKKYFLENER